MQSMAGHGRPGGVILMHFSTFLLNMLPQTSLFRSGEPFYLIAIPFLVSIPETMVMLHLAWRSIGLRIPVRRSLGASVVVGLGACLVRQLVPVPFHILPNLAILIIYAKMIGQVSAARALLGGVFAVSITIMGSFLTIEPLLILFTVDFIKGSLGYALASLVETVIPLIVLALFARFNLILIPRGENAANDHAKKTV